MSPCPTADDTITISTCQKAVVLELKRTLCSPQRLTIFIAMALTRHRKIYDYSTDIGKYWNELAVKIERFASVF